MKTNLIHLLIKVLSRQLKRRETIFKASGKDFLKFKDFTNILKIRNGLIEKITSGFIYIQSVDVLVRF